MKHNIVLKGYGAYFPTTPSKMLCLGTAESYGIEQLNIIPGAGWEGLVIKATFHPASSEPVVMVVGENGGVIDVPPEATAKATAESSPGVIVFSGVADGVQRISANLAYTVIGHASVDGKDPEPTPSQWEQLAALYQSKVDKQQGAENAGKVLGIGEDGMVKPVKQSGGGGVGNDGATFIPFVSEDGVISWTNDGDLPNPEPVNIKGPIGETGPQGSPGEKGADGYTPVKGVDYFDGKDGVDGKDGEPGKTPVKGEDYFTEADKQEIAQEAANKVKIPDKLPNPNALTFTGAVEGSYDGSAPLTVEIPQGGSGGASDEWVTVIDKTITLEEPTLDIVEDLGRTDDVKEYVLRIVLPKSETEAKFVARINGVDLNQFNALNTNTNGVRYFQSFGNLIAPYFIQFSAALDREYESDDTAKYRPYPYVKQNGSGTFEIHNKNWVTITGDVRIRLRVRY